MFYLVDSKTGQRVVKAKSESFLIKLMNSVGYDGWAIEQERKPDEYYHSLNKD